VKKRLLLEGGEEMPKVFTVGYLVKDKDLDFEGGVIKVLSKFGYSCIDARSDEKMRVLLFGEKEEGK